MLWCGYSRAGPCRFTASVAERGAEKRLRAVNSTPTGSRHGHEPVGVDFNDEGTAVGATGAPFAGAHPLGLHEFAQPAQPILKYNVTHRLAQQLHAYIRGARWGSAASTGFTRF